MFIKQKNDISFIASAMIDFMFVVALRNKNINFFNNKILRRNLLPNDLKNINLKNNEAYELFSFLAFIVELKKTLVLEYIETGVTEEHILKTHIPTMSVSLKFVLTTSTNPYINNILKKYKSLKNLFDVCEKIKTEILADVKNKHSFNTKKILKMYYEEINKNQIYLDEIIEEYHEFLPETFHLRIINGILQELTIKDISINTIDNNLCFYIDGDFLNKIKYYRSVSSIENEVIETMTLYAEFVYMEVHINNYSDYEEKMTIDLFKNYKGLYNEYLIFNLINPLYGIKSKKSEFYKKILYNNLYERTAKNQNILLKISNIAKYNQNGINEDYIFALIKYFEILEKIKFQKATIKKELREIFEDNGSFALSLVEAEYYIKDMIMNHLEYIKIERNADFYAMLQKAYEELLNEVFDDMVNENE